MPRVPILKTAPRVAHVELKANLAKRELEGYASVWDVIDAHDDRVLRGAYTKTLVRREKPNGGWRIPLLWQHRMDRPIGVPKIIHEENEGTGIGLYFKDVLPNIPDADMALEAVHSGLIDGVSVGIELIEWKMVKVGDRDIRDLIELDLFERSLVSVPANDEARLLLALKGMAGITGAWVPNMRAVVQAIKTRLDVLAGNEYQKRMDLMARMGEYTSLSWLGVQDAVESGRLTPTLDTLEKWGRVLGMDVDTLCKGAEFMGVAPSQRTHVVVKEVIPFDRFPLLPEDEPWNGPLEIREADVDQLRMMSTWFDEDNPELKSSYKLPHHRAEDNWTNLRGVQAAMGALFGARAPLNVPDADRRGIYDHLAGHLREFDREPPEFRSYTPSEIKALFPDLAGTIEGSAEVKCKSCGSMVQKGEHVTRVLQGGIDAMVTHTRKRGDVLVLMADSARRPLKTIRQILSGHINCPPLEVLRGLASAMEGVTVRDLVDAAIADGCDPALYGREPSTPQFLGGHCPSLAEMRAMAEAAEGVSVSDLIDQAIAGGCDPSLYGRTTSSRDVGTSDLIKEHKATNKSVRGALDALQRKLTTLI